MKSIIQDNKNFCYLCGRNRNFEPIDEHHVFTGSNRGLSEKYGLKVYLHHYTCHIFGVNSVHQNREIADKLKREAQESAMQYYGWSERDFIKIFGRNYL